MFFKDKIIKIFRKRLKKIKFKNDTKFKNFQKQILRILNHDIKTALLAQTNCLELLLKEKFGSLNTKQKEIVNEILSSNMFLEEIVANAILLGDIKEKTENLQTENVDIISQTLMCVDDIKPFSQNKHQKIILKTDNDKINLVGNKSLIKKIIHNLLAGSVSYGFDKSDIIISIKENKNSISFCAENKSVYMTKEKIKNIFENDKQNSDFNQLGMNLNLNIAKKLINAHNWDFVLASNKKNKTSTFGFVAKK